MEKINLNEIKALQFIKEGLMLIGFPENVEVCSYIGDQDRPCYYANYEKIYNDEIVKHIKPLRVKDVVDLMKFAMEINGYEIEGIDIRVRDETVAYSVKTNIVTYADGPKKNKRRR